MDKNFAAFGRRVAIGYKRKSSIYAQFMLACLLAHLPQATALPGPIISSPAFSQTINSTAPTPKTSIHEDNPITTITFGVFSTVIAFGSLVVGALQYRRWRNRHSTRLVEHDEEMREISRYHTPSGDTVVEEGGAVVTLPLQVLTSPVTHPSPSASRSSTIATQPTLVEPEGCKSSSSTAPSMTEDAPSKESRPSPLTKSSQDTEHLGLSRGAKPFDD